MLNRLWENRENIGNILLRENLRDKIVFSVNIIFIMIITHMLTAQQKTYQNTDIHCVNVVEL